MWQGYQQLQLMCEGFALRDTYDLEDAECLLSRPAYG